MKSSKLDKHCSLDNPEEHTSPGRQVSVFEGKTWTSETFPIHPGPNVTKLFTSAIC
jgi:hypothetical protein